MQTVIITGMSGAGKSTVVHILEDIGYYCIDNIPATLISNFITLCQNTNFSLSRIAFVVDARSGELVTRLSDEIDMYKKRGNECSIIFLDADDETIIRRYKETRRKHPHANGGRIETGIKFERALLSEIRKRSDLVLDTSGLYATALREKVLSVFQNTKSQYEPISVNVVSFGFKRGIPLDCDLVFDVRFMPNPFYDDELRKETGKDPRVAEYALSCASSQSFLQKLEDMLTELLPLYVKEGKQSLVIGIGCTGGKHRSVAVTEYLAKRLSQKNYLTVIHHRDMESE